MTSFDNVEYVWDLPSDNMSQFTSPKQFNVESRIFDCILESDMCNLHNSAEYTIKVKLLYTT